MLIQPWPENLTLTQVLDQYRVEINLLRYWQQINIAKAIPILITMTMLFSSEDQYKPIQMQSAISDVVLQQEAHDWLNFRLLGKGQGTKFS